jgi:chaperone required for assembly of F1-ATPase
MSKRSSDGKFWAIALDQRVIKTLYKDDMILPSYGLALALADEWEAQIESIDLRLMHVNSMFAKQMKMHHDDYLEPYMKKELLTIIANDNLCHVEPEGTYHN